MAEDALLEVLPEVFRVAVQTSPPLRAVASVATQLHAPVVARLDHVDEVVDPLRTPEQMVGYLASWVDLDWLTLPAPRGARSSLAGGSAPLRDLVTAAADLSARRGTPGGMREFLRVATGVDGFVVDDVPGAFHLVVTAPAAAGDQIDAVRRIVHTLKPAHVTAQVVVASAPPAAGAVASSPNAPDGAP